MARVLILAGSKRRVECRVQVTYCHESRHRAAGVNTEGHSLMYRSVNYWADKAGTNEAEEAVML
jgi:hypothetical protein